MLKYVQIRSRQKMTKVITDEKIKQAVRQTYGGIARRFVEEPGPATADRPARTSCCGRSEAAVESAGPATAERPVRTSCCGRSEAAVESAGPATAERPARTSCCGRSEAAVESAGPARAERPARASCCDPSEAVVESTGLATRLYSAEELADLPDSVTEAALGCGNPTAIAELQPGEVVLDLGSGGGIDCFLAARQVGPGGQVIGLDMTLDMIKLARRNAKKMGATNVDFRYGEMEDIPLPDESVDVIISNCVINLSPDKDAVFRQAYRVLRPGGRMSISDIVIDGQLPQSIRGRLDAWASCLAGALDESDYLGKIGATGFEKVQVTSRDYAKISEAAEWEEMQALLDEDGLSRQELDHKVASIKVKAFKPA
jgi:arsenite methyltransferase